MSVYSLKIRRTRKVQSDQIVEEKKYALTLG